MKKLLYILLCLPLFIKAQTITNANGEQQSASATKGVMPDTSMRGGHQFFIDTAGRNAIPLGRRRYPMWVTTANNSGSDGVKTTWRIVAYSAANGSNWEAVKFGADTTIYQTVANFKPLGNTYWALKNGANAAGTWGISITGSAPQLNGQSASFYLSRANHTGTQPFSSITGMGASDVTTALTYTPEDVANKTATQSSSATTYPNWAGVSAYFAPINNAALTGTPTAPTPGTNTNNTQIPTTSWTNTFFPSLAGTNTFTGTNNTFNNGIQSGLYTTAPTLSLALVTTGGSVTAGTYYYKVVAYDSQGNPGAPSNEVSGTITAGQYNFVRYNAIPGAVKYRLFRYATSGATTSAFTDFTFTTSTGAPPGVAFSDINNGTFTGSATIPTGTGSFVPSKILTSTGSVFGNSVNIYTAYNATADNQTFIHNQIIAHQVTGTLTGGYNNITSVGLDIAGTASTSLRVTGNIIPLLNNSVSLGTGTQAWGNIYTNSLLVGSVNSLATNLTLQNSSTIVTINGNSGSTWNSGTTSLNTKIIDFNGDVYSNLTNQTLYGVGIKPNIRVGSTGATMIGLYVAPTLQTTGVVATLTGATVTTGLQASLTSNTFVATGGTGTLLKVLLITNSSGVLTTYAPSDLGHGQNYTVGDVVTITGVPLAAGGTTSISFTVGSLFSTVPAYSAKFDNAPISLGYTPATATNLSQVLLRDPTSTEVKSLSAASLAGYTYSTATDANTTITATLTSTKLPTITANRTITLPTAASVPGQSLKIWNQNTSGTFTWSFSTTVKDAASNTITTLANQAWYILESDGTNWNKIN